MCFFLFLKIRLKAYCNFWVTILFATPLYRLQILCDKLKGIIQVWQQISIHECSKHKNWDGVILIKISFLLTPNLLKIEFHSVKHMPSNGFSEQLQLRQILNREPGTTKFSLHCFLSASTVMIDWQNRSLPEPTRVTHKRHK